VNFSSTLFNFPERRFMYNKTSNFYSRVRYALVFIISLSFTSVAQAIVNVENSVIGKPKAGLHTELGLSIDSASGNTNKKSAKLSLKSQYSHQQHTEYFQAEMAYGSSRGVTDTRRTFAHFRHHTQIGENTGIEGFLQASQDPFARMSLRTLIGGGMRWSLIEKEQSSALYAGLGAFLENERLNQKVGTADALSSTLWRANSYMIWKLQLNEQVRFYNSVYYQPRINQFSDFRLLDQASVMVKLNDSLDIKLSLDVSHDSRPPQTVKQTDVRFSTGISASF